MILARMRRAKGLSGGSLGQLAGMSQPKVSRIENGRGLPDPEDGEDRQRLRWGEDA